MDGVAERPAFRDRERRGLLQIHVLAGLDRMDGDDSVPVIGRADDDRVDVLVREQFLVVAVRGDAVVLLPGLLAVILVDQRAGVLGTMAVEIADGHDSRGLVFPDPRQIVHARNPSVADGADVDAIGGRERPEHGRRHDRRESGQDGCRDEAFARCGEKVATRRRDPPFSSHV